MHGAPFLSTHFVSWLVVERDWLAMMMRLIADREKRKDADRANRRDHSSCLEIKTIQVAKGSHQTKRRQTRGHCLVTAVPLA